MHIPLDLCIEILEIIIKHINELDISRARRLIFLLIYKIYCKCLWLHLGTVSKENVIKCIGQLEMYFQKLLDYFFVITYHTITEKYLQHGIVVKNMLHYTKKCMQSKIEHYSKNHDLANLFTLTYGGFTGQPDYYHMHPVNKVKSIVTRLDQHLITLLLNQIKGVNYLEFTIWETIEDDENTIISLQRAIVTECHYFMKLIKQNKFLIPNDQLLYCLEQFISPRNSEESILTLQEICHYVADGRSHGRKELIKRYKEWDSSILDFIYENIPILIIDELHVILEYLYYTFTNLSTNAEKYKVYVSVLKILMRVKVEDLHFAVQNYVRRHFDDNPLTYLYNENCFSYFLDRHLVYIFDYFNSDGSHRYAEEASSIVLSNMPIFLIFILLNPKKVLNDFIMANINDDNMSCYLLQDNMHMLQWYYVHLKRGQYNMLLYILKDLVFQNRMILCDTKFMRFLTMVLYCGMIRMEDLIYELYLIPSIHNHMQQSTLHIILVFMELHISGIEWLTRSIDFHSLTIILIKLALLLKKYKFFSTEEQNDSNSIYIISKILEKLRSSNILTYEQWDIMCSMGIGPLEMSQIFPAMNTLKIIQEYVKRCYVIHRRLRTDMQCHPKLRNHVQSFNLDREDFIRHMIMHCIPSEYIIHTRNLTFNYWYHFGWANEIAAYENVMRIIAETSQIVLVYIEMFSKNVFVSLLFKIVQFSSIIEDNRPGDQEVIRHILLKTLFSIKDIISRTNYNSIYREMLECIQRTDMSLSTAMYFNSIREIIQSFFTDFLRDMMRPLVINRACTCNRSSSCEYHDLDIEREIVAMYDAYLFICECIKLPSTMIYLRSERLLHKLCFE
ncbi:uncharacterized protein LOC105835009 [Monomorium pharaonis]|uniref:uncharacterized protein LOC105835009 n=1 Tax=Monomorium pharaonis TaxID=307658 RepID=UPI00063FAB1F|nr:uncharacterized protein LOC105835009 [Monomorium pharaonis]